MTEEHLQVFQRQQLRSLAHSVHVVKVTSGNYEKKLIMLCFAILAHSVMHGASTYIVHAKIPQYVC